MIDAMSQFDETTRMLREAQKLSSACESSIYLRRDVPVIPDRARLAIEDDLIAVVRLLRLVAFNLCGSGMPMRGL